MSAACAVQERIDRKVEIRKLKGKIVKCEIG